MQPQQMMAIMEPQCCFVRSLLILLLMTLFRNLAAMMDQADFLALQTVRKQLDDMPGSDFFAAWDFTTDPCDFPGVFCAGNRVAALALGDPRAGFPGLRGRLDPAIGRLSELAEFSIVPGRVAGPVPDGLGQCAGLRFIALSRNLLSGHIPASLGALPHLHNLDLSYNQLSGTIPKTLAAAPALANLILCHNQLSGTLPRFRDAIPLLRLDLKYNRLSGRIPPLPASLQYLALGSNALNGRVDAVLPRLPRLNFLDLSTNHLSGPVPSALFGLPLTALQLQRNAFSGRVEPTNYVAIPVVDLSYNRLWGPLPPQLAGVGRLYLNSNRFTGVVPSCLVQGLSGGMELLYLQHNFLTGIEFGPAALAAFPAGTALCLQYNCMVLPLDTPCPFKAGAQKMRRPADQCPEWRS